MKTILIILAGLALGVRALGAPLADVEAERIADAIWHAEGGARAKVSHGVLSVRTRGAAHAREVCLRTIRNNWTRWEAAGRQGDYLAFLAARYAPLGAGNDPRGLNRNWLRNVRSRLGVSK